MRFRRLRQLLVAGVLGTGLVAASAVTAQYTGDPYFDATVMQSRAIGFEMAEIRLRLVRLLDPPYDTLLAETIEPLAAGDFRRFAGRLAEIDPELAEELNEVLDAVAEGVERNEWIGTDVINVEAHVPIGLVLLEDAYDLVIPPEIRDDPVFKAGVIAQLLLAEGGAAEGIEEAAYEPWAFAAGWFATQRVKVLWEDLRPLATEQQQADIDEMLAVLDELYPTMFPPESLAGIDPEEAEAPAQRIVGILEVIVDAQLYSGRDQVRLIAHLIDLTTTACDLYAEGSWPDWTVPLPPPPVEMLLDDPELRVYVFGPNDFAREIIHAVYDHYAGETTGLGALVNLFAPEVHQRAMDAFLQLVAVELPLGPGETPPPRPPPGVIVPEWMPGEPRPACAELLAAFEEAQALF